MRKEEPKVEEEEAVYFYRAEDEYGFMSQWYMEDGFKNDEGIEFSCCEQYMMWGKAKLFGDEARAEMILQSEKPYEMLRLGRRVVPFREEDWKRERSRIVEEGNYFKFSQNEMLRTLLLATGDRPLVEASPPDTIWGIGISVEAAKSGAKWRGLNLLGKALQEVRHRLRHEERGASTVTTDLVPSELLYREDVRLAIDCGGVISCTDTDTQDESDLAMKIMKTAPTETCVKAVALLVKAFGPKNVFILSKAKARVRHATAIFLSNPCLEGSKKNFFEATGLLPRNVIFCAQRSGGMAPCRFSPIAPVLGDTFHYVSGPRVAVPDKVGKGPVAQALRLTHLIDDRLECLQSFWFEGLPSHRNKALFHFYPPPSTHYPSDLPVVACPRGWLDVLDFFASSSRAEEARDEAVDLQKRKGRRQHNKTSRVTTVQSSAW